MTLFRQQKASHASHASSIATRLAHVFHELELLDIHLRVATRRRDVRPHSAARGAVAGGAARRLANHRARLVEQPQVEQDLLLVGHGDGLQCATPSHRTSERERSVN